MKKKHSDQNVQTRELDRLFKDLSTLIEDSKRSVISQINNTMTMLFWQVGKRINENILKYKRAEYGEQIVVTLSRQLTAVNIIQNSGNY